MSQLSVCRGVATKVIQSSGSIIVSYHNTHVVTAKRVGNQWRVTLNTGGWRTNTTKTRMNQASNQYGLGFQVYQSKGAWFVRLGGWNETPKGEDLPFNDRMISFTVDAK